MLRTAIWVIFFGLIVGGCASDGKIESSSDSSSTAGSSSTPTVSSPTMSAPVATESTSTSQKMSDAAATEAKSMNQSKTSQTRIAAGVEEETLDSCLGRIPKDATAGQKMLAEQTCRRDFSGRR